MQTVASTVVVSLKETKGGNFIANAGGDDIAYLGPEKNGYPFLRWATKNEYSWAKNWPSQQFELDLKHLPNFLEAINGQDSEQLSKKVQAQACAEGLSRTQGTSRVGADRNGKIVAYYVECKKHNCNCAGAWWEGNRDEIYLTVDL